MRLHVLKLQKKRMQKMVKRLLREEKEGRPFSTPPSERFSPSVARDGDSSVGISYQPSPSLALHSGPTIRGPRIETTARELKKRVRYVFVSAKQGHLQKAKELLKLADGASIDFVEVRDFLEKIPQYYTWNQVKPLVEGVLKMTKFDDMFDRKESSACIVSASEARATFAHHAQLIVEEFLEDAEQLRLAWCTSPTDLEDQGRTLMKVHVEMSNTGNKSKAKAILYGEFRKLRKGRREVHKGDAIAISLPGGSINDETLGNLPEWSGSMRHEAEVLAVNDSWMTVEFQHPGALGQLPPEAFKGERDFRVDKLSNRTTLRREIKALETIFGPPNSRRPAGAICKALTLTPHKQLNDICSTVVLNPNKSLVESVVKKELNESQLNAFYAGLHRRLVLIQGPPGTGKTKTACHILKMWAKIRSLSSAQPPPPSSSASSFSAPSFSASSFSASSFSASAGVFRRYPCLATAGSNTAVDNLVEKLHLMGINVVRVRSKDSKSPIVKQRTLDYLAEVQNRRRHGREREIHCVKEKILKECDVVCATCCGVGSDLLRQCRFDSVLVDEATQVTEPELLIAISRGCEQLVLIGDHCQLPPVILSRGANKRGLGISLLERLVRNGVKVNLLDTQYRMHPAISSFPSLAFYGEHLKDGIKATDRKIPEGFQWPRKGYPIAFVNIEHMEEGYGKSFCNMGEVKAVTKVVGYLLRDKIPETHIGIITPYDRQKNIIRQFLKRNVSSDNAIEISTVDGFQGREKEVIVISLVRSNKDREAGFVTNFRRANVMLTRARSGLIVIGNARTVCQTKKEYEEERSWSDWLAWAISEKCVCGDDIKHSCKFDREKLKNIGQSRLRAIDPKARRNWRHYLR